MRLSDEFERCGVRGGREASFEGKPYQAVLKRSNTFFALVSSPLTDGAMYWSPLGVLHDIDVWLSRGWRLWRYRNNCSVGFSIESAYWTPAVVELMLYPFFGDTSVGWSAGGLLL